MQTFKNSAVRYLNLLDRRVAVREQWLAKGCSKSRLYKRILVYRTASDLGVLQLCPHPTLLAANRATKEAFVHS